MLFCTKIFGKPSLMSWGGLILLNRAVLGMFYIFPEAIQVYWTGVVSQYTLIKQSWFIDYVLIKQSWNVYHIHLYTYFSLQK